METIPARPADMGPWLLKPLKDQPWPTVSEAEYLLQHPVSDLFVAKILCPAMLYLHVWNTGGQRGKAMRIVKHALASGTEQTSATLKMGEGQVTSVACNLLLEITCFPTDCPAEGDVEQFRMETAGRLSGE